MAPYLDIFRIESNGVLWFGAVTTVETAQDRIQKLAYSSPGSYLILNQTTGQRIVVTPASAAQREYQSVESAHHGPRVGYGLKGECFQGWVCSACAWCSQLLVRWSVTR